MKWQWHVVRELLHEDDRKSYSPDEASKLWSGFSLFLIDKLNRIANVVRDRLASTACMVHPPVIRISTSTMSTLEYVTTDEVAAVIRLLPQKSSTLDVMPVSLLKLSADIMAPLARLVNLSFGVVFFHPGTKAFGSYLFLRNPTLYHRTQQTTDQSAISARSPKYFFKNCICSGYSCTPWTIRIPVSRLIEKATLLRVVNNIYSYLYSP